MTISRDLEVELVHALSTQTDVNLSMHFLQKKIFIDNINGAFDTCDPIICREGGVGERFGTWSRARAIIYALLNSLNLNPILGFNPVNKNIRGLGLSDDHRYSLQLEYIFDYTNTYYHQAPFLDVMKFDSNYTESSFDFVICSDVLEHVIGNWKDALINIYRYLKPGGFMLLSVPWTDDDTDHQEHYPGCIDYEIEQIDSSYVAHIKCQSGNCYTDETPFFHGGPGNTLELRIFSKNTLLDVLNDVGYINTYIVPLNNDLFGLGNCSEPGIVVAYKP